MVNNSTNINKMNHDVSCWKSRSCLVTGIKMCLGRNKEIEPQSQCLFVLAMYDLRYKVNIYITAPKALQPFQTLAMIYEELGDIDKSMQVYLCSTILYQFK